MAIELASTLRRVHSLCARRVIAGIYTVLSMTELRTDVERFALLRLIPTSREVTGKSPR